MKDKKDKKLVLTANMLTMLNDTGKCNCSGTPIEVPSIIAKLEKEEEKVKESRKVLSFNSFLNEEYDQADCCEECGMPYEGSYTASANPGMETCGCNP